MKEVTDYFTVCYFLLIFKQNPMLSFDLQTLSLELYCTKRRWLYLRRQHPVKLLDDICDIYIVWQDGDSICPYVSIYQSRQQFTEQFDHIKNKKKIFGGIVVWGEKQTMESIRLTL